MPLTHTHTLTHWTLICAAHTHTNTLNPHLCCSHTHTHTHWGNTDGHLSTRERWGVKNHTSLLDTVIAIPPDLSKRNYDKMCFYSKQHSEIFHYVFIFYFIVLLFCCFVLIYVSIWKLITWFLFLIMCYFNYIYYSTWMLIFIVLFYFGLANSHVFSGNMLECSLLTF